MNDIEKQQEKQNKNELTKTYKKIAIIFISIILGFNLIGMIIYLIRS